MSEHINGFVEATQGSTIFWHFFSYVNRRMKNSENPTSLRDLYDKVYCDCLVAIHRKGFKGSTKTDYRNYLYRALRNAYFRHSEARRDAIEIVTAPSDLARLNVFDDPEQREEEQARHLLTQLAYIRVMEWASANLPVGDFGVFQYYYSNSCNYKELADLFGITTNKAVNTVQAAVKKIRNHFNVR